MTTLYFLRIHKAPIGVGPAGILIVRLSTYMCKLSADLPLSSAGATAV